MKVSLAKAWFVLSIGVLGVAYGIAANQWGWFPNSLAKQAWRQAEVRLGAGGSFTHLFPRVYEHEGVRPIDLEKTESGVTLVTSMWKTPDGWEPRIKILSKQGKTLHEWRINKDILPRSNYLHGTYLFPNGDIVANVEYVGTVRLNSCGGVLWRLPERTHHSITRAKDGSFWIPARKRSDTDEYPGLEKPVNHEIILKVSEKGRVTKKISVLELIYKNDLERHIFKVHGGDPPRGITHMNDVEPLDPSIASEYPLFEGGDLLVSLRNLDLVLVFDPKSQEVKWHASAPFSQQHDPDFIGEGWVGVFDNNPDGTLRGTAAGGSRIVAIQPHSDSTKVLFPTQHSEPFYTEAGGKWQKLENGNMLLTEARAGRVVEVDENGATVWEWIKNPTGSQVAEVLEGTRQQLTASEVKSWSCSSKSFVRTSQ